MYRSGGWIAYSRENSSFKLLEAADRRERINLFRDQRSFDWFIREPMHLVSFRILDRHSL